MSQEQTAKPLLKQSERDSLALLFSDYFRHRAEDKDIKALQKASDKLTIEIEKRAKALKLSSLLESPIDMRWAMNTPTAPEKSPKKGLFHDSSAQIALMSGSASVQYLYRLPKAYSEKTLYPTIIALGPKSESVATSKKWAESAFPEAIAESCIILVPLNPKNVDWTSLDGLQTAIFPLREGMRRFTVDRGRVFLDGSADAGPVVVTYATLYPGLFTGVVVRAPSAAPATQLLANARAIPLLVVVQGTADGSPAAQLLQDVEAAGVKASKVDGYDAAGALSETGTTAIQKFVAETQKVFSPREIKFTTTSRSSANAYWLELTDFEASDSKPVTVEAVVDRTKNEILITAPASVSKMTVYLNQDLIDMGKQFKILVKKKGDDAAEPAKRFDGSMGHNFDRALGFWFDNKSGNSGEAYSNFCRFSTTGS